MVLRFTSMKSSIFVRGGEKGNKMVKDPAGGDPLKWHSGYLNHPSNTVSVATLSSDLSQLLTWETSREAWCSAGANCSIWGNPKRAVWLESLAPGWVCQHRCRTNSDKFLASKMRCLLSARDKGLEKRQEKNSSWVPVARGSGRLNP